MTDHALITSSDIFIKLFNDPKVKRLLFNLGPKNRWEIILEEEIKRKIELLFQDEMKELGYL